MTRFEECLEFIKKWEGGKVDHPSDPGGRTNKGITQSAYDIWLAKRGEPSRDVFLMTDHECVEIYYSDYWIPAVCNELPEPLDLIQFDTAVQRGTFKAKQMLQRALGVLDDGVVGPQTLAAVAVSDPYEVARKYAKAREAHYIKRVVEDYSQRVFLAGWMNRIHDLKTRLA